MDTTTKATLVQCLQQEIKHYIAVTDMLPCSKDFLQPNQFGLSPLSLYKEVTGTTHVRAMLKRLGFDCKQLVTPEMARREIQRFIDTHGRLPKPQEFTKKNGLRRVYFYGAMLGIRFPNHRLMVFAKLGFCEPRPRDREWL